MKKLILTVAMALSMITASAQSQLGVLNIDKNSKEIPVDYWYVLNGKGNENTMYYYNETSVTKEILKNMLATYGQSLEKPFGEDEDGDDFWIITHPSGNIVYLYLLEDGNGKYAMIISITK